MVLTQEYINERRSRREQREHNIRAAMNRKTNPKSKGFIKTVEERQSRRLAKKVELPEHLKVAGRPDTLHRCEIVKRKHMLSRPTKNGMRRQLMTAYQRFVNAYEVDPDTGCWIWQNHIGTGGYGHFRLNKEEKKSHRASYAMSHGSIPKGMVVMHACDNPNCVNPEHLHMGTQQQNMNDSRRRNASRFSESRTKHHDLAPLIRQMYQDGYTFAEISRTLKICYVTTRAIALQLTHKPIPRAEELIEYCI